MRRRSSKAVAQSDDNADKPPMGAILDHYDIEYRDVFGWQTTKCPFHSDSTDSFRVNLEEGGFKCLTYACGKSGGDALEFIKLYEECDYPTALKIAEGITGVSYSTVSGRSSDFGRSRRVSKESGYRPTYGGTVQTGRRRKST